MAKKLILPSELEFLILKVLWQAEANQELPLAVRDVRKRLAESGRDIAHTSVISTLNVMLEKAFVKRTPYKNAFLFAPRVKEADVHRSEVTKLIDRVFDGSAESLMSALLKTHKLDPSTIAEIKQLIDESIEESGH